jgi:hypothetical protein
VSAVALWAGGWWPTIGQSEPSQVVTHSQVVSTKCPCASSRACAHMQKLAAHMQASCMHVQDYPEHVETVLRTCRTSLHTCRNILCTCRTVCALAGQLAHKHSHLTSRQGMVCAPAKCSVHVHGGAQPVKAIAPCAPAGTLCAHVRAPAGGRTFSMQCMPPPATSSDQPVSWS